MGGCCTNSNGNGNGINITTPARPLTTPLKTVVALPRALRDGKRWERPLLLRPMSAPASSSSSSSWSAIGKTCPELWWPRMLTLSMSDTGDALHVRYERDQVGTEYVALRNRLFETTTASVGMPLELCELIVQYQQPNLDEHILQLFDRFNHLGIHFNLTGYEIDHDLLVYRFQQQQQASDAPVQIPTMLQRKRDARSSPRVFTFTRLIRVRSNTPPSKSTNEEKETSEQSTRCLYLRSIHLPNEETETETSKGSKKSLYPEINREKFKEAYRHFYRFQWSHGRQHQYLGVCFFAGLLLGAQVKMASDPSKPQHQFLEFSPH